MNCEQFERLFALQVEGDLPDSQQAKVSKHLLICGSCHRFAEEIRDSQASLRSYTGDDFDDTLLAGIRHSVMSQIHSGEITLSRWERIAGWFGVRDYRRFVWAISGAAAILVLAGSVAIYLVNGTNKNIEIRADVPHFGSPGPAEVPPRLPKSQERQYQRVPSTGSRGIKHLDSKSPDQTTIAILNVPFESTSPTVFPTADTNRYSTTGMAEFDSNDKPDGSDLPVAATPKNMTRIEMRTARQNIKIIWFAEKKTSAPPAAALSDSE